MKLSNYYTPHQLAVLKSRIKSALLVEGATRVIVSDGRLRITNDKWVTTNFNYSAVDYNNELVSYSTTELNEVFTHLLIECKSEIY